LVESHYRTQVQVHNTLETHGVVADWKPGMSTVWASTQGTASVRDYLCAFFKLPKSQTNYSALSVALTLWIPRYNATKAFRELVADRSNQER
jgi:CO/xanthine dehydrogenase Mo-binding subunit